MLRIRSFGKVTMLLLILLLCPQFFLNGCARPVIQSSARNQPEPNAIGYNLPKGLIHLTVKPQDGSYNITFAVMSVPDANYLYTLTYLPKSTADDTINITVGANGLLQTISTTTTDKMPEIISKIAGIVPEALKGFIPPTAMSQLKLAIKNIDVIFDPDDVNAVRDLKKRFYEELGADFEVKALFVAQQYPEPSPSPHSVYYRLLVPYRVYLRFKSAAAPESGYYEVSSICYVPNRHSPILSCDITRAAFVTKTYTLTFSDGILTGSQIVKPSEVSGFMSIPLDIAKAIVAVPGSIVKFRIDTTTQSKALLDAQTALIASQEARIKALESLEKTKKGSSTDTNPPGPLPPGPLPPGPLQ